MHEKVIELFKLLKEDSFNFIAERVEIKEVELKEQLIAWCELLESEKYKKGTSFLYSKRYDTHCCLGVAGRLCEVDADLDGVCYPNDKDLRYCSEEPLWKYLQHRDHYFELSQINDFTSLTFKEIATLIRYKYYL